LAARAGACWPLPKRRGCLSADPSGDDAADCGAEEPAAAAEASSAGRGGSSGAAAAGERAAASAAAWLRERTRRSTPVQGAAAGVSGSAGRLRMLRAAGDGAASAGCSAQRWEEPLPPRAAIGDGAGAMGEGLARSSMMMREPARERRGNTGRVSGWRVAKRSVDKAPGEALC
jgi:hypothetical protein